MKKYLLLGFLLSLWSLSLFAQPANYRHYKTVDYMAELKKDRNVLNKLSQLERDINKTLRFEEYNFFTLPIVFHVLYENNSQRVSEDKFQAQLEVLNEAFSNGILEKNITLIQSRDRRNLIGYKRIREDTRVQFCFPIDNPQNKPTSGVNYERINVKKWTDYDSMKDKKRGVKPWNTERYINVWVVNLPDTIAGFAQMPNGPKGTDGIVIDYSYIENIGNRESPYNGGHTLTHLMGNYLGLLPLWGESPCGDDNIDDTPIHNAPNFPCPDINHISLCSGNPTEMSNNFMDNTYDDCLEMFTHGQMARIQKILHPKGPRGKLGINKRTQCQEDDLVATTAESRENATEEENQDLLKPEPYSTTLNIRPNPAHTQFQLSLQTKETSTASDYSIEVFNLAGQRIHQFPHLISQFIPYQMVQYLMVFL